MSLRFQSKAVTLGAVAACLLAACAGTHEMKSISSTPQQPGMSAEEQEMMEKWAAYATPGSFHKQLDQKVGRWSFVMKHWMDPAAPPMESTGTADCQWTMGGRYLREEVHGSAMGQPFEGVSITGYDNMKKQYVATWIDNMGTGIVYLHGTWDPARKSFNLQGEMPDPTTGKFTPWRYSDRWIDANTRVMDSFGNGPDGKEFRCGEIAYTRTSN